MAKSSQAKLPFAVTAGKVGVTFSNRISSLKSDEQPPT